MDVQRAGFVLLIKGVVRPGVGFGIAPTQGHGELPPGIVGVDGNERVIEIEKSQVHSFSSMDLISGMVIARWVRRA
ncbi:hypothetical protein FQZ97_1098740 [compost metagenome]